MALPDPPYGKQPVKSLYLLYEALEVAFVKAPLWVLYALPKSKRPRPSWSLYRVIRVNWRRYRPYIIAK